jgi:hypothetical protein
MIPERVEKKKGMIMGMFASVPTADVFRDVLRKAYNSDRAAVAKLNRMMDLRMHEVVTLQIARLNATQKHVNHDYRRAARRRATGRIDDLPCVVRHLGLFYVTDGHHRIMAAADAATSVRVRLFDLDGDLQTEFPLLDDLPEALSPKPCAA